MDSWECGDNPPSPPPPDPGSGVPDFFEDFPFLTGLIDLNDCGGTTVSIYEQSIFTFIHIQTADAGTLYFQDGTRYCTDGPGLDCVAAYGLSAPVTVWTCDGTGVPPNPQRPPLFDDYPWLDDVVDLEDCGSASVTTYASGAFLFFFVDQGDGLLTMYNELGQFYCQDSPGFSCVAVYGLSSSDIVERWECMSLSGEEAVTTRQATRQTKKSIRVYPNPTAGQLTVAGLTVADKVSLHTLHGALLQTHESSEEEMNIDMTSAPAGVYLIIIESAGTISVERVVRL